MLLPMMDIFRLCGTSGLGSQSDLDLINTALQEKRPDVLLVGDDVPEALRVGSDPSTAFPYHVIMWLDPPSAMYCAQTQLCPTRMKLMLDPSAPWWSNLDGTFSRFLSLLVRP